MLLWGITSHLNNDVLLILIHHCIMNIEKTKGADRYTNGQRFYGNGTV